MQTILIAGAGKSSIYLIEHLLEQASVNNWKVIVADSSAQALKEKVGNHPAAETVVLDIHNDSLRESLVQRADLVVSLMPPTLHILLSRDCLKYGKNLITSSYISPEMRSMDADVKAAGLMFMCEMGLDPGIDHMSAHQIMNDIEQLGGVITSFKSYCGGLVAPSSDNNPWHYKFSWNPRNVVTAGADGAHFLQDGKEVHVPYEKMFENNETIDVKGLGKLAFYPNRDSLSYLNSYPVPKARTFLRATLRYPEFCEAWQALVVLGLTEMNDVVPMPNTYLGWMAFKMSTTTDNVLAAVCQKLQLSENSMVVKMLQWIGLFDNKNITTTATNSGEIILSLLVEKWDMKQEDKDMVVMQHEVAYAIDNREETRISTLVLEGKDREHSAMARTVGMPMAILAVMIMKQSVALPHGVHIPDMPEIYEPILHELQAHEVIFHEQTIK